MKRLSRRGFLGGAAALGGAALLQRGADAQTAAGPATADIGAETLTGSPVEKIAWKAKPFAMPQVRLLPSRWMDMQELNRSFLYSLPNDRLAYNFRVTAGLATDAVPLGGWEAPDCELRGHYVGHYLSACALLHASTGDLPIRDKANALVGILAECQAKDGYLGAYPTTLYDRLRRHEKVWAPFYTYHKIVAGLLDMYVHTGNVQALQVAVRMMDWADTWSASFTPDDWQQVLLTEHGGMNEASFNLYAITGNTKYRELGFRFEHKKIFDPLAQGEDRLAGNHANTNIPKMIGAARGYEVTGAERYNRISRVFYQAVVEHHSYCTGGTSNDEFWHQADAVATQLGGAAQECCCVYNMMKLTRHLFGQEPDAKHFDYYERVLMNVRRGTQDRNGMLMYYVSLQPGLYKTFGTPFGAFWCCTGTGSEEYAKLTDSIYFHDDRSLYVNLFIASKLDWAERGLRLRQTTTFPYEEKTTLTIDQAPREATAIRLRVPYWATSGVKVRLNGAPLPIAEASPSSYLALEQMWKSGDVVEIEMPMTLHIAVAPDDTTVQAAMYGPVVLAALLGTEGLTTNMIYNGSRPEEADRGMPMPQVTVPGVWFERAEATKEYALRFRSRGDGPIHTLVPLNEVMDERYSVYLKNVSVA